MTLTDQRSGESFDVSARAVINATGVWAGEVDPSIRLRPSRGTHLVFDAAAFGNPVAALTIPIPGEINRFVFAMPEQLGRVYLGSDRRGRAGTDSRCAATYVGRDLVPARHRQHRTRRRARSGRRRRRICRTAAADRHGGGRSAKRTAADVSREHAVIESPSGVISVIGGKLTEYRFMAEDVLDRAVTLRGLPASPCRTRNLPLVGAPANPVATLRSPADLPGSLVARYGAEAPNVSPRPAASGRRRRWPRASTSPERNSITRPPTRAR